MNENDNHLGDAGGVCWLSLGKNALFQYIGNS